MWPSRVSDGTSLANAVKHAQLWKNFLLDENVGSGGELRTGSILLHRLNAGLMDEERIVQDLELVVQHAKRVTLFKKVTHKDHSFFLAYQACLEFRHINQST